MTRNRAIDAVRAVACIFVLFVHCPLPGAAGLYVSAIARFAVPFFLMVSGYYAFRGEQDAEYAAAKRQLGRTARLTLAGTLFCAAANTLRDTLRGGHPLGWLNSLLNQTGLFRFFVFNRAIFLSSVMYYLFMLLYVYALFLLLVRTGALRASLCLIPLLLGAGVVLNAGLKAPWYYTGNFLLTGLPFFLLGYWIAARRPRIIHPEVLLIPGVLLCCLDTRFNAEIYCGPGALILSLSVFFTCLIHPQARLPEWLVRFGRRSSVILFLIHCQVRDFLQLLLPAAAQGAWLTPLLVLAVSVVISALLPALQSLRA